jgi:hypothetical protein
VHQILQFADGGPCLGKIAIRVEADGLRQRHYLQRWIAARRRHFQHVVTPPGAFRVGRHPQIDYQVHALRNASLDRKRWIFGICPAELFETGNPLVPAPMRAAPIDVNGFYGATPAQINASGVLCQAEPAEGLLETGQSLLGIGAHQAAAAPIC